MKILITLAIVTFSLNGFSGGKGMKKNCGNIVKTPINGNSNQQTYSKKKKTKVVKHIF